MTPITIWVFLLSAAFGALIVDWRKKMNVAIPMLIVAVFVLGGIAYFMRLPEPPTPPPFSSAGE